MSRKVLVIEDEPELATLIKSHLAEMDCRVKLAFDSKTGLAAAEAKTYDLVILDLMRGGKDGLEICRRLRARSDYPPIVMLSSRGSEMERIIALEMGADDYVTKPFNIFELMARVKGIFRRVNAIRSEFTKAKLVVRAGGMIIDSDKRSVVLDNRSIDLTAKEFALLLHLAQSPGRVYTREQILDFVWGYNHAGYEHTVNSHVNRLRGKIERDPTNPVFVRTVWGVGYKFSEDVAA
jgi:two-component system, OmpR family, alkaline phosphatase synthesis response regulator PhoP